MNSYHEKIKGDLLDLYEGLYFMGQNDKAAFFLNAEILSKIKYKPEEVKKVLNFEDNITLKKKQSISSDILAVQTRDQALEYFKGNLECIFGSDIVEAEKNIILKKISVEELRHLYQMIFGISLPKKCKKMDVLYKIKDFCENEKRTDDLIKNLY